MTERLAPDFHPWDPEGVIFNDDDFVVARVIGFHPQFDELHDSAARLGYGNPIFWEYPVW